MGQKITKCVPSDSKKILNDLFDVQKCKMLSCKDTGKVFYIMNKKKRKVYRSHINKQ